MMAEDYFWEDFFHNIIKKGHKSATFLPQVWNDLPSKEDFFNHLSVKAELSMDEWKKGSIKVETYQALVFGER